MKYFSSEMLSLEEAVVRSCPCLDLGHTRVKHTTGRLVTCQELLNPL